MTIRIIPRLDIKGPNLVKGIHLEGLRVLGKPERFARFYYEGGADELFFMDVVASLYGRNQLTDIVARTAREIFIPLCVGGGLRSVDDIRNILRAGADKVALNTAALARPDFVCEAARTFGSSTIVVAIEAIRQGNGRYECFTDCGREATGVDALTWAVRAAELGAGEIIVTSVDREGTGRGFDLVLTRSIARSVNIPVIAHGGAGNLDHVCHGVAEGECDAVALASMLHYEAVSSIEWRPEDFSREGNIEFIKQSAAPGRACIEAISIAHLKAGLVSQGIDVRMA
jgi:imidazole glycerol-phosphate synthase subunit HisF